jgi:hypothetical protein
MFQLNKEPAPASLAPLGTLVELHELPMGALTDAMRKGGHAILAASLHIDGVPVGDAGIDALPGRFAAGVAEAEIILRRMHDLDRLMAIHEAQEKVMTAKRAEAAEGPNV